MRKALHRIAVGVILASGCSSSLVGTWMPDDAAAKSKNNDVVFKQIQFQANKKYLAAARQGEKHEFLHGSYEFNGKTLTLKSDGRADRTYDAIIWWGRELRLASNGNRQVLRKQ